MSLVEELGALIAQIGADIRALRSGKANTSHTHLASETTNFTTAVQAVPGFGTGGGAPEVMFYDASGNALSGRHLKVIVNPITGAITDIQSSTGPDSTAPSTPGTPVAVAGVNQNTLSWTAATDNLGVTSYRIYRSNNPTTILATVTTLNYTDTTATPGTAYTYTVDAVDAAGNASAKSSASNSVTATMPSLTNTAVPTITGSAVEGQVLTAVAGTWSPSPDMRAYKWQRNGVDISGAVANTYTLVSADVGATIRVIETASKSGYTGGSATSAATATVTPVGGTALNNTVLPAITGSAVTGQTLTVTPGTWSATPDQRTYQWTRDGANISSATGTTYVLQVADEAKSIRVVETVSKANYTGGSATSNAVTPSAPSSGSVFVSDSFTEATTVLLPAHTGEIGATWTNHPNFAGGAAAVSGNRVRSNGTVTTTVIASGTSASADYSVEADFVPRTLVTGGVAGIALRVSPAASTWYVAQYAVTAGEWQLRRIGGTGGSNTLQAVAQALTLDQSYHVKIVAVGTSLSVYVDNMSTPILTATDANHAAAGRVGVTFSGSPASTISTGLHIDNFVATS